ncbi:hypothetical protein Sango_0589800 [Sesamum angolense]|uniref:Agenet domain-containing protein n=1 Tax=Sesamum angolense TaxID=2727404 RepID=A0AAE1X5W1_9LAMI|nr:hypothetical protein Sango_0589800 [Sesamum angolense]
MIIIKYRTLDLTKRCSNPNTVEQSGGCEAPAYFHVLKGFQLENWLKQGLSRVAIGCVVSMQVQFFVGIQNLYRWSIRDVTKRKGHIGHVLEYYDFPDEKLKWTKLYQRVPQNHVGKAKEKHRELMLRPCYPPIYNQKQVPQVSEISEVAVIVDDSWKVGDLVDWWTTDCYWSGRITKLLADDKAEIELHPPPLGEGSSYEIHLKDIRPSLDWSPQCGWTVPNQEGDTGRACARLIKPVNQGCQMKARAQSTLHSCDLRFLLPSSIWYHIVLFLLGNTYSFLFLDVSFGFISLVNLRHKNRTLLAGIQICVLQCRLILAEGGADIILIIIGRLQIMDTHNEDQETEPGLGTADSSVGLSSPVSSNSIAVSDEVKSTGTPEMQKRSFGTSVSEQVKDIQEKGVSLGCEDICTRKTSSADSDSGRTSAEPAAEVAEKNHNSSPPVNKYRANGQVTLHSMRSDTFEAAILDLEDYLNKVKRLKAILHYGISSSDAPRSQWEFVEPHAASEIPK